MSVSNKAQYLILAPAAGNFPAIGQLIVEALREDGLEPISAEESFLRSTNLVDGILRAIKQADFVIADVTAQNPNVFFRVGLSRRIQKTCFIGVAKCQ